MFLSTRLQCHHRATRMVGSQMAYAMCVRRNIGFYYGHSWATRQPPSFRYLASHTVFNLTFNLSSFILTGRTLYHQYLYAVESIVVPKDSLVPLTIYRLTFYCLTCSFLRDKRYALSKRFHEYCVVPSERYWATSCTEHFAIIITITRLCE